jgi:signal transduction histidine kinase
VQDVAQRLTLGHAGADSIGIHIAVGLPPLHVDPTRIRLLVRHLLDNALRHGAVGSRPQAIHVGPRGDGRVHIRVRDYGPGVSEEHLSELSQAFYRPDSARTRSSGGVGLGLTLCRLVAQAHGGDFSVRRAEPGLEVSVSLTS